VTLSYIRGLLRRNDVEQACGWNGFAGRSARTASGPRPKHLESVVRCRVRWLGIVQLAERQPCSRMLNSFGLRPHALPAACGCTMPSGAIQAGRRSCSCPPTPTRGSPTAGVLPLLPPRYHAFALDQRGHGDSERPACCYSVDDFAADVVAFLDAVRVERASLVGHSGAALSPGERQNSSLSASPAWC
jgi:hypothetical protein